MKITFVLPPFTVSGGIRVVIIYARLLMERGHEVVLISPPARPLGLKERVRRMFAKTATEESVKSYFAGARLDHRVLERWRPVVDSDVPDADVVVATWWETAEWVAALTGSKGAKVYFVQGHEIFSDYWENRCRATYMLPMHKIVVARWLSKVMSSEYADHDVDIVPNSVDHVQFFASERSKQRRPTVGFLYAETPIKGIDVTLRAIELLRARLSDLHVISFGGAMPDERIAARMEFHHNPPQSTLRDIYASCDVWLTASRSEGFNLTAMEAMACRTPVVSTRTGWPEESIVDGLNGYCVDIDDALGLSEAAYRLLTLSDKDWSAVSREAFETVRSSSWERAADLYEQALIRTVDRRKVKSHAGAREEWRSNSAENMIEKSSVK